MDSMKSGALGWLVLLAILTLSSSRGIHAQQEPTQGKQPTLTQATSAQSSPRVVQSNSPVAQSNPHVAQGNPPAIDIKVETFRKQLVPGDAVGVVADITNNSGAPVYMRQQDVQLAFALLLARSGFALDGSFPTEYMERNPLLCLKPGETYRVFWVETPTFDFWQWLQYLRFVPGAYPITVEAKYWDKAKFDSDDYHTAVAEKTVDFAAPESIILFGAVLGGFIFALLSWVRAEEGNPSPSRLDNAPAFVRIGLSLLGSALLSVIITILLSRIQETQFFIKVSVSDLWGAIAIGFLGNYGGFALLDKMIPGGGKDKVVPGPGKN
jgi:hypothetical protein